MNRLNLPEETHSIDVDYCSLFESRIAQEKESTGTRAPIHHIFIPLHYEGNYKYPLLVWLHGPDADERQLTDIMPAISMRNYVGIAPRVSPPLENDFSRANDEGLDLHSFSDISNELHVVECVQLAQQRFNIAPNRVFLAGYQSGGTMAFRIAMANPKMFAGAMSLGGPFPMGNAPLASIESARAIQLMVAHGRDSCYYSEEQVCRDLRLMHTAGLSITLRQYSCGDELTSQMLRDLDTWTMEQVTGTTCTPNQNRWRQFESLN